MVNWWQIGLEWFSAHGWRIVLVLIFAFIIHRFSYLIINKVIRESIRAGGKLSAEDEEKREQTLMGIFHQLVGVALWITAGIMILSELGIDTGPLIASAGIVGVAFGFGGQYLIKDLISGFFILLENQYRVGDVICLNNQEICGLVENINVRTTILRDLDGTVHYVPNGEIKTASNLTRGYARVNLNIGVSYDDNLDKAIKVINKVGQNLAKDPDWREQILEAPQVLRVDGFADSAVMIKILGKTKPVKQWDVTGELRKRLKNAFDKEGITIPFPQRVIHQVA